MDKYTAPLAIGDTVKVRTSKGLGLSGCLFRGCRGTVTDTFANIVVVRIELAKDTVEHVTFTRPQLSLKAKAPQNNPASK